MNAVEQMREDAAMVAGYGQCQRAAQAMIVTVAALSKIGLDDRAIMVGLADTLMRLRECMTATQFIALVKSMLCDPAEMKAAAIADPNKARFLALLMERPE